MIWAMLSVAESLYSQPVGNYVVIITNIYRAL